MDKYIPASIETPEQLKHYKHAEAQCRYREKSIPSVSFQSGTQFAPEIWRRLVKRHANGCNSYDPELPAPQNLWQTPPRNVVPATLTIVNLVHSPFRLRKRKFVAKFGEDAFFDFYLPQHNLRGAEHLPGIAVEYAQLQKRDHVKEKGGGREAKAPTC
ncbi:hypothetical protein DFH08DRAFT_823595 [Mycena albidolilacea]|uniref:Uncharacterized protein n=1 Tax=Mycena albidolilacea TaxID=1033008 RepID=A0AAD6Z6S7_9AGAR|nr:hypothetical protein DFH08DRAFT_823595 [Mycena albidolilacea]